MTAAPVILIAKSSPSKSFRLSNTMSKTSHNSVGQIRSRLPQFFYQKILREQSVDVELIDQQHGKSQSSLPNKRSSIWPRCLSPCTNPWFWETISAIFSLLCLTAIFVILAVYNNSPSPSLPHSVILNAIVSILATGSKASLIFHQRIDRAVEMDMVSNKAHAC